MATSEQIKALIRAHLTSDNQKFRTVALQIAAHEAKIGHTTSAREIKDIIQNAKQSRNKIVHLNRGLDILDSQSSNLKLVDIVLPNHIEDKLKRVINEYRKKEVLRKNGLMNRHKILLTGKPGTGKTMTASVLAGELYLPLYVIQLDRLITKYMGETSVKIRQVFEHISDIPGVYLFDEFDAIGSDRSLDNDVGEMRRILNFLLQQIEADESDSIIIAATNNPQILDKALFRRFDDIIEYDLPGRGELVRIFEMKLAGRTSENIFTEEVYTAAAGLNYADIVKACEDVIKYSLLEGAEITEKLIINSLEDKKKYYSYKEA